MKRTLQLFTFFMLAYSLGSWAQNVKGIVVDDSDGLTLPGVNVIAKGTSVGVTTDFDGNYEIDMPDGATILEFSFMGYVTKTVDVSGKTEANVSLVVDAKALDEVVVTALGIKREKKALGYAVAEVGSEAFESAKAPNAMSSLSGRMSGVQVSSTGQGPASSTSVIIRGTSNLSGSNEPLYVVDGIPISNNQFSNADSKDHGGIDSGNGMSAIAADDIENVSVLKGPAATALYGSRAMNGVVLITTKSGKGNKGTSIDFSSTTSFENARIYSDWQDKYGQGTFGNAPTSQQEGQDNTSMWGSQYANTPDYIDYKGNKSEYKFHDNENNFYNTGVTYSNSVAVNHNTESSTLRMSYSNLKNEGMLPNTDYLRNTFTLNGTTKSFDDKLEVTAKLSYINEESKNQMIGASPFSPSLMGTPNNVSLSELQKYKDPITGLPIGFGNKNSNVYWTLNEIDHNYGKDRIISMGQIKYSFTDELSAMVRFGNDYTMYKNISLFPIGTPYYESGRATSMRATESETNIDALVSYNKDYDKWGFTVNAGGSTMYREFDASNTFDENFIDQSLQGPGLGSVNNHSVAYNQKKINSVYGTAQFRYDNLFYLDFSARNDWSSTLPLNNNSYFYPSVSSSLIITELFDQPNWFSFGKVRASWAQVGSDTDPYQLALNYRLDNNLHPGNGGDSPSGEIDGGYVPNDKLRPSIMSSYEFGIEMKFFENRLGLDIGYYSAIADDQIMPVNISNTSGFETAIINAGSIKNSGIELSVYAEPIKTNNFSWNTIVNYSYNENEVLDLTEGVTQLTLFDSGNVSVVARPGEAYGQILGTKYKRDENTNKILLDDNGRPMVSDELHVIGNGYHKVMLGWINQFSYKNFSATIVMDGKFGGDIYSTTEANAMASGRSRTTLQRDGYDGSEWFPKELEGQGTTSTPQELFGSMASIDEQFIYDASYLSIQEISVSYRLPSELFKNSKFFKSASTGLFVRNLGYIWKATDNIDPQSAYSISNGGGGVEMGNMSLPTSYGINVNIKF